MKTYKINFLTTMTLTLCLSTAAIAENTSKTNNALTPTQVTQVKGVVHDYLVTNPQVLVEASQSLQQQEMQKMTNKAKENIVTHANDIFQNAATPVSGNPSGDVTLVEFFDYQCPHCKEMKPMVDQVIASDPKLRIVYKQLPIFGQTSRDAAAVALAAAKQGPDKFIKLHEALLAADNPLNKDKALQIAKSLGLDTDQLIKDMSAADVQKQIDDNMQLAQALNLIGTPTFIIAKWSVKDKANNVKNAAFIPGMSNVEDLKAKIAAVR